jgi:predicted DNA-binding WGR domain protein
MFLYKDENSNKFWSIDTKGSGYAIKYVKIYHWTVLRDFWRTPEKRYIGEVGQISEKTFEDESACKKEVDKLIAKKLKEGYVEHDKMIIDILNNFRGSKIDIMSVLEELEKCSNPLTVAYDIDELVVKFYALFVANEKVFPQKYIEFVYRLHCLEGSTEQIRNDIIKLYGYGLMIAAVTNNNDLEKYCLEHLPEKIETREHAFGLAYIAALNNNKDDFIKYIEIGCENSFEDSGIITIFDHEKMLSPYKTEYYKIYKKKFPNSYI